MTTRLLPLRVLVLFLLPPAALAEEEDREEPPFTAAQRGRAIQEAFRTSTSTSSAQTDRGSSGKQYAAAVAGWAYLLAGERSGNRLPPARVSSSASATTSSST